MSRLAVYEVSNIENFVCDRVRKTRRFLHKVTDLAMSALISAIGFLGYPRIRLLPSGDVTAHYSITYSWGFFKREHRGFFEDVPQCVITLEQVPVVSDNPADVIGLRAIARREEHSGVIIYFLFSL